MKKTTIIGLIVAFVLIAAVIAVAYQFYLEEVSDHVTVTPTPTPSPSPSPSPSPTPTPTPTPEVLKKEIHQEIDTTPALAGLLKPGISNVTAEDIGFEVAMTDDVHYLPDVGKPSVPYIIKKFKIPKDSNVELVSVNLSNPIEILDIFIEPNPKPVIVTYKGKAENVIDEETYSSSEQYPGKEYEYKESVGIDLDTHLQVKSVVVYIFPIQYIPVENRIIAYKNATISIFYCVSAQEESS